MTTSFVVDGDPTPEELERARLTLDTFLDWDREFLIRILAGWLATNRELQNQWRDDGDSTRSKNLEDSVLQLETYFRQIMEAGEDIRAIHRLALEGYNVLFIIGKLQPKPGVFG